MGEDVSGEGSVGSVDFSPASPSTWQKLDLLLAFSLTTVTSHRGGAAGGGGIAITTVINMLRSARRRREFVYYQIKPPSHNI